MADYGKAALSQVGDLSQSVNTQLADKAKKNDFVYVDDYVNQVTNSDWTNAIQAAFDTQKPVVFGFKKTYQVSKTVHANNNKIINGNFSTIQAVTGGTYDNVILYGTGQPIANTPTVFDISQLNRGRVDNLTIDCNNIANIIGMAPVDERLVTNPINYYSHIKVDRCAYGIYGQDQSVAHAGGFTGSVFDNLYVGGVNGMYLGSNQDDITFNSPRLSCPGIGIQKGGYNVVFNSAYIALTSDTAVGVKLNNTARSVIFNSLFIESSDKTNFKNQIPVYLNGTSSYPIRNIVINGLTLNISSSNTKPVIYSFDVRNDIFVNGLTGSFGSIIIGYYLNGNTTNYSSARIICDINYSSSMIYHESPPDTKRLLTKTTLECLDGKRTIYGLYEVDSEGLALYSGLTNYAVTYPDLCGASGLKITTTSALAFSLGLPNNYNISGTNKAVIENSVQSTANMYITEVNGSNVGAQQQNVNLVLKPGERAIFMRDSTNNLWQYIFNNAISNYDVAFPANTKVSGRLIKQGTTVYLAKDASLIAIG